LHPWYIGILHPWMAAVVVLAVEYHIRHQRHPPGLHLASLCIKWLVARHWLLGCLDLTEETRENHNHNMCPTRQDKRRK
jgi:hypothetical protein